MNWNEEVKHYLARPENDIRIWFEIVPPNAFHPTHYTLRRVEYIDAFSSLEEAQIRAEELANETATTRED